jgi:phosphopantetheine--protein transferase-like protein
MIKNALPNIPTSGEVHVYWVENKTRDVFLTESDITRAQRFKAELSRDLFIRGRSAIRAIAGSYTCNKPLEMEIGITLAGKPFLKDHPDLHFNITHCHDVLGVAFACTPVGFDMESKSRKGDFLALAKRFFSTEEYEMINKPHINKAAYFLERWTAKEAMLKLIGTGIAAGLDKALVLSDSEGSFDGKKIHLHRLNRDGYVATVASFSEPKIVREMVF